MLLEGLLRIQEAYSKAEQLPTFLLFRDRRSLAQQCWIRLHSSSNILGDVASVCTPLPTRTQQLPTLLAQQCWELLRPFARSLRLLSCLAFSRRHSEMTGLARGAILTA